MNSRVETREKFKNGRKEEETNEEKKKKTVRIG